MAASKLRPYIRPNLDVLFVALNPPTQSDNNGHWFSGDRSRFFQLLHESGLITEDLPKATADEAVFDSTTFNFRGFKFGVIDLVEDVIQTNSGYVRPSRRHVDVLIERFRDLGPRFVCVIHYKVRDALNQSREFEHPLDYGICGRSLRGCGSVFVLNYFPNGNNVNDEKKLTIFRALRDQLVGVN